MRAWIVVLVGLVAAACGGDATVLPNGEGGGGAGAGTAGNPAGGSGNAGGQGGGSGGVGGESGGFGGTATGGSSGVTCNPSGVLCDAPTPFCPPGEVASVEGSCWGDCVPILSCATEPSCDNCQGGFCAAYVSFTTEYRCVVPSLMCSALACSCLAPYFCAAPFDACVDTPSGADVTCECPTC